MAEKSNLGKYCSILPGGCHLFRRESCSFWHVHDNPRARASSLRLRSLRVSQEFWSGIRVPSHNRVDDGRFEVFLK